MTTTLTIPTATGTVSLTELTRAVPRFAEADDRQARVARIRAELADVAVDEQVANRMNGLTTGEWRSELRTERRDCYEALARIAGIGV